MKTLAAAAAATIAVIALSIGLGGCGHHSSKPAGDTDKASDCWAHPDTSGRRHCAT